jgi:hypothetical protein
LKNLQEKLKSIQAREAVKAGSVGATARESRENVD